MSQDGDAVSAGGSVGGRGAQDLARSVFDRYGGALGGGAGYSHIIRINGGNGQGVQKEISYTLTTSDIHAIYKPEPYQEVVGALMARDYKGVNTIYVNQDEDDAVVDVFMETK